MGRPVNELPEAGLASCPSPIAVDAGFRQLAASLCSHSFVSVPRFRYAAVPPTPIGVADITESVEHSERAVFHNGRWIEPRFDEQTNTPDPFDGCVDCPQRTSTDGACCGAVTPWAVQVTPDPARKSASGQAKGRYGTL